MPKTTNILIKVLTQHERTGWVCPYLAKWLTDFQFDQFLREKCGQPQEYMVTVDYAHNFMPAASARNNIANQIKDINNLDWLVMIDNDMAPQPNLLETIKDAPADADIIVPRFSMWDEGKASVTLCWGMELTPETKVQGTREFYTFSRGATGFYPLTKCGTGCIFIKPHVFQKITPPYFWYPKNKEEGNEGTEDITFTKKVCEAGMKIYGNAGVMVGHYHNCNLEIMAHAVHMAKIEAVEEYKKEQLLLASKGVNTAFEGLERPSLPSVVAACPAS